MKIKIYLIRVIFVISIIYLGVIGDFVNMVGIISALAFTYVPELLKKVLGLVVPTSWHVFAVLFIFASQWLGTYLRAYDAIPWWDVMLHAVSGVLVGLMGLLFVELFDREQMLYRYKKYGLLSFIVFLTATASASVWEMLEFIGDTFLGTNAQLGSLVDTMEDISICVIIGSVFSVILYYSLKAQKDNFLKKQIEAFFKENEK